MLYCQKEVINVLFQSSSLMHRIRFTDQERVVEEIRLRSDQYINPVLPW